MLEKTFTIGIDRNFQANAAYFFNSTLSDIMIELLQNARRSGADKLEIEVKDSTLSFQDNGCGFFNETPQINLGGSRWSDRLKRSETPAGFGLFSLATRNPLISSKGEEIALNQKSFTGEETVTVKETEYIEGTRISFDISSQEKELLLANIEKWLKYYPVETTLNGRVLPRQDFLQSALFIEEWQGLKIGVFPSRTINLCLNQDEGIINFYGLTIPASLPQIEANLANFEKIGVRIEVVDAPDLKLVLPARKEVVHNEFYQQLLEQCEKTLFRYCWQEVQAGKTHGMNFQLWSRAKALGFDLPEAEAVLQIYRPHNNNGDRVEVFPNLKYHWNPIAASGKTIYKSSERNYIDLLFCQNHAANNPLPLLEEKVGYEGYSWYDALTTVEMVSWSAVVENETVEATAAATWEEADGTASGKADSISYKAKLTYPDGTEEIREFPAEVAIAFDSDGCSYHLEECGVLLAKSSAMDASELADVIENALFNASDDCEADSYETQRDRFLDEAYHLAISLVQSPQEADLHRLKELVRDKICWAIPSGKSCAIAIDGWENIAIELKDRAKI